MRASAEESLLIVTLGEWVLRAACRQLAVWQGTLPADFTLSVNVSALQLAQPGLGDTVRAALEDAGADPRHLALDPRTRFWRSRSSVSASSSTTSARVTRR